MKRLAIWRDGHLDWHVNQAKQNGSRFYPRINICDFDGWRTDLCSVAL